jgi:hypothetical protein
MDQASQGVGRPGPARKAGADPHMIGVVTRSIRNNSNETTARRAVLVLQQLRTDEPDYNSELICELPFGVACNEPHVCAPALSCLACFLSSV